MKSKIFESEQCFLLTWIDSGLAKFEEQFVCLIKYRLFKITKLITITFINISYYEYLQNTAQFHSMMKVSHK